MKHFRNVCITPQPCHNHFCCWLLPIWPKLDVWAEMELMACAELVGSTKEQSCLFPDLIWYYQWYETLQNFIHYTSAVPEPFLLLIAANLALARCLGWKWSLWPVHAWLAVQKSKDVFFLTVNISINEMKYSWTVYITPQPCHSYFCCWLLPFWL